MEQSRCTLSVLLAINEINERLTKSDRSSLKSGSQQPTYVEYLVALAADSWGILVRAAQENTQAQVLGAGWDGLFFC